MIKETNEHPTDKKDQPDIHRKTPVLESLFHKIAGPEGLELY